MVLYDPEFKLIRLQRRVQEAYMDPEWVIARISPGLSSGHEGLSCLDAAARVGDQPQVCTCMGKLVTCYRTVPLLQKGITPSSGKPLSQIAGVYPDLYERIIELEGSRRMSAAETAGLVSFFSRQADLNDRVAWRGLLEYFEGKLPLMARNGLHHDVVDMIWFCWQALIAPAEISSDKARRAVATLAEDWLGAVGWCGPEVIKDRVGLARLILEKIEDLAESIRRE